MSRRKDFMRENETYEEMLIRVYPLDRIEENLRKIEFLGYLVKAQKRHCIIFKYPGRSISDIIIDSDFYNDYHLNAAGAIHSFWHEE